MEKSFKLRDQAQAQAIFGPCDQNIRALEKELKIKTILQDGTLKIKGTAKSLKKAQEIIGYLLEQTGDHKTQVDSTQIHRLLRNSHPDKTALSFLPEANILRNTNRKNRVIGPKTQGQREYFEAIKQHDIVFGLGPAGTGKTYLAMAAAVEALDKQEVRRIILTRPAIEAGESLGFLPGDMYEKISPYLRPLYDAIYDMMDAERIEKYLETGIVEVAPLAYMRGRTLNDAFIVLDEAQNCTIEQMKMFLTRLGFDSKAVITGDITQSDLPNGKPMGLLQAREILQGIEGIKFIELSGSDVVRHALVQKIIEAYDKTKHI
ncbi:MAG: PhoH family protein [Candidatus Omnitrophica bacterium]|jgi:phosphate starvation-inducible PhoH-like protein|nr:PhoH family protein [Candidatus Omnitrophota bacterium]